jgi:hypothetical protein
MGRFFYDLNPGLTMKDSSCFFDAHWVFILLVTLYFGLAEKLKTVLYRCAAPPIINTSIYSTKISILCSSF